MICDEARRKPGPKRRKPANTINHPRKTLLKWSFPSVSTPVESQSIGSPGRRSGLGAPDVRGRARNLFNPNEDKQVENGTVKRWYSDRGFGFIQPDKGGKDVFVGRRGLSPGVTLAEGDRIEFTIETDKDGRLRATNVKSL